MTTMGLSPAARKASLRRTLLAARDRAAAPAGAAAAAAAAVSERALADATLAGVSGGGIVAGYWPIRSELDPRPLMRTLAARGVDLALPVITADGLMFRRWLEADELIDAGFGTLGPSPDKPDLSPDILLVPLAAADPAGNRLGYGRGYYDAAIARLAGPGRHRPFTVGLGYDVQLVDSIPAEPHDQPLDAIVTPMQSIVINNFRRIA
ncbi:5-formyltetrahydrofolate cyclo-ligase [Pseudochelatococcus sp. B33]